MLTDRFRVGVITTTHGLKGEVKVFPTTEDPKRFLDLKEVIADNGKSQMTLIISSVRFFKHLVILGFEGYDSIDDVTPLKKWELYVSRENAIPLEEGEYYVADLIGLEVYSDDGRLLGKLRDVIETGANDVYSVHRGEGMKDLLIPVIDECILDVDVEGGTVKVHLLPGLEELN